VSRKPLSKGRKPPHDSELPPVQVSDLSRHLIRAQEGERKRISRELHDEAGQGLMVLRLYLGMLAHERSSPQEAKKVQEAISMLDRTIGDLRRIIARLSPRALDDLGLVAAIRKEARELSRAMGMKAFLDLPESLEGIDRESEVAIYRSVQEALNNIAKHSRARSFRVAMQRQPDVVLLLVEDDGIGLVRNGGAPGRTFGIVGMRERIAALGGTVRIRSRHGRGTRVQVMLPAPELKIARKSPSKSDYSGKAVRTQPEQRQHAASREIIRGFVRRNDHHTNAHPMHSS
jgi:two-component system sensor histidine kinase NreB